MINGNQKYDMSNFPDNHPCFEGLDKEVITNIKKVNKKVLGKMKDELKGNAALEFAGLRAKMYSILYKKDVHYEVNEFEEV